MTKFLNFVRVPALFISPFIVFHRILPVNERKLSPYLFVFTCGSLHRVYTVRDSQGGQCPFHLCQGKSGRLAMLRAK